MRRLREQYPNELVVIGVHSAKFPSEHLTENIRQAVLQLGIDHPVINDVESQIWDAYAVRAWPTLVLIDPHGRIADTFSGEILAEDLSPQIEDLVAENPEGINRAPLVLQPETQLEPAQALRFPARILVDGERMFIADSGHHRILEVQLDEDGLGGNVLRTFGSGEAGLQDGTGERASFRQPHGLTLLGSSTGGRLYVADTENHAIRRIDLSDGSVQTVAGTGEKAHGRVALGNPKDVPLRSPWAVLAYEQVLFIAMAGSHQIWLLINEERIGPFAGTGQEALVDGPVALAGFNQPSDLSFGTGYLFIADAEASAIRAINLNEPLEAITLAGQGLFAFGDVDGSGAQIRLQHPTGLTYANDTLYIADTYNHKIKAFDPYRSQMVTLIGDGQSGSSNGPFEAARLYEPEGVWIRGDLLYIADTNNHLIRVADLAKQVVSTFDLRGAAPPERDQAKIPVRLAPVDARPGVVEIVFDLQLPEGTHLNPDAPSQVYLVDEGPVQARSISAGGEIGLRVRLETDRELRLDLYVYYCQESDAGLCYVHNREILLPVRLVPDGSSRITVPYQISRAGQ